MVTKKEPALCCAILFDSPFLYRECLLQTSETFSSRKGEGDIFYVSVMSMAPKIIKGSLIYLFFNQGRLI